LVPRTDLVNALEFEEQARRKLAPAVFAAVAGSHRLGFDRITLRPRMCVPVLDMDLSVTLFGDLNFAPIVVGPIERQQRFHPDGELATVRGAAAARAAVVVSSHSSVRGGSPPRLGRALVSDLRERSSAASEMRAIRPGVEPFA
jgi:4-hydroxymandelate oxidase